MSTRGDQTQQRGSVSTDSTPTPRTDHDYGPFPRGNPELYFAASTDPRATLLALFARACPSWHDRAACKGSDVDFTARGKTERARAFDICGRCPVRVDCLEWALDLDDDVAVLGGTDPAARRRMKRDAA